MTIETLTYRKPTFTGVMLNWNSLTSIKYKTGLIRCLLDRSFKICSSERQKDIEMEQLRILLLKNNYPKQIIEKEFNKFLEKKSKQIELHPANKTMKPIIIKDKECEIRGVMVGLLRTY